MKRGKSMKKQNQAPLTKALKNPDQKKNLKGGKGNDSVNVKELKNGDIEIDIR